MTRHAVDVVILGGGSVCDVLAPELARAGRSVMVVEAHRVGGECPYVACMPSKAMLHDAHERRGDARHDAGAYRTAALRRDHIADHLDDSAAARALTNAGVRLVRGEGVIVGPQQVSVGDEVFEGTDLVICTGSSAVRPPIEGIGDVDAWYSDDALTNHELPQRVAVLGGGPVGCELADVYSAFGAAVLLIDSAPRLLAREEPLVGETLRDVLQQRGIGVLLGAAVRRMRRDGGATVLVLDDGSEHQTSAVVVAVGRTPRLPRGLDRLGVAPAPDGALHVDSRLRVRGQDHVWAGGDVTGEAPFTHTASYHGRVLADNLLGGDTEANHAAIPRTVYTEPPVACVGLSSDEARAQGVDVVSATQHVSETARGLTDDECDGSLTLVADRRRGVLIGAAAITPRADELIGEAAIAIRGEVPLRLLADVVHPFPTFSELYDTTFRTLRDAVRG
jgi:pyruvate/2-oxoglutarate dehydrogenase complex dihydrolipoamide dehydrogenase (E3) component